MIRLKLTVHVQARLYERHIDVDHIKGAIGNPDENKSDPQGTKVKKKVGDKTIVVVYSNERWRDQPNTYLIITAYYLSK